MNKSEIVQNKGGLISPQINNVDCVSYWKHLTICQITAKTIHYLCVCVYIHSFNIS